MTNDKCPSPASVFFVVKNKPVRDADGILNADFYDWS